jgi:hypothetical protein
MYKTSHCVGASIVQWLPEASSALQLLACDVGGRALAQTNNKAQSPGHEDDQA